VFVRSPSAVLPAYTDIKAVILRRYGESLHLPTLLQRCKIESLKLFEPDLRNVFKFTFLSFVALL
jgi:hypothetical protein